VIGGATIAGGSTKTERARFVASLMMSSSFFIRSVLSIPLHAEIALQLLNILAARTRYDECEKLN